MPAASGSVDYGRHFTDYLQATFGRPVEVIPIYRDRDARRGRNLERLAACPAVYLGGGLAEQLLDALAGSPAAELLAARLRDGGLVVAIAAAAQACGEVVRAIAGGGILDGLGLLPGVAVETNFDPAHDRRLRQLVAHPRVERGIGLAAGALLMVGSDGRFEAQGDVLALGGPDADLVPLVGEAPGSD